MYKYKSVILHIDFIIDSRISFSILSNEKKGIFNDFGDCVHEIITKTWNINTYANGVAKRNYFPLTS